MTYHAGLLPRPGCGSAKHSNSGHLTFLPNTDLQHAPQQVTVSLSLHESDEKSDENLQPRLEVTPERVSIPPGAPVVWNFAIPLDIFGEVTWAPEILFTDGGYGPFRSMTTLTEPVHVDPVFGAQVKIIGTGDNGHRGSYNYRCRVRGSAGVLATSSDDPGVDDDGELMTPPDVMSPP